MLAAMTKLLKKAFQQLAQLPDEEQDSYAKILLDEVESDQTWLKSFRESEDVLKALADEALEEHKADRTTPLDFSVPPAKG